MTDTSGFDAARLGRLAHAIQADVARGDYFGAAVIVSRRGRIALREVIGARDAVGRKPITYDSVFPLLSISKSLLAVAVLSRVERGDIALTSLVTDLVPEFEVNGKAAVTVAQLLSHTSGLGEEVPPGATPQGAQAVLDRICKAPLRFPPGRFAYSGETGYFILGEMLRRLDGDKRSVTEILDADLFQPLGMRDTSLCNTKALSGRRVPISIVGALQGMYSSDQLLRMEQAFASGQEEPGGSAIATADDLHRFATMLANGGVIDGTRILSARMISMATQIHTGDDEFGALQFGRQLVGSPPLRANYGLGFQMRGPVAFQPAQHGSLASPGTFGHRGAGLTCYWVDPATQVVFVCLTSGLLEETRSTERWQRLSDIVHSSIV